MTARELYLQIEDKLSEALALCDVVAMAAGSESCLNPNSAERVMNIVISDLGEIVEFCENATDE